MASVVTLAHVDSRRIDAHVVEATLSWTVRSLVKVRKAAKARQRVTSKAITVPHPAVTASGNGDDERRSQWRAILIPKGRVEPDSPEDAPVYMPEFVLDCLAPIDGQADGVLIEGFRCRCVVAPSASGAGLPQDASAQAMEEDGEGTFTARIEHVMPGAAFEALGDTLQVTIILEILEQGHRSAELLGSIASVASQFTRAVSASEVRGVSTALPDDAAGYTSASGVTADAVKASIDAPAASSATSVSGPSPEDVQRAAQWSKWFAALAMDGAPFPPRWQGEEFAWVSACTGIAAAIATMGPPLANINLSDAVEPVATVVECMPADRRAEVFNDGLPADGNVDEMLVDAWSRAREAFPALKAIGNSGWGWMQFLYCVRVAAVAGPELLGAFAAGLAAVPKMKASAEWADKCAMLLSPNRRAPSKRESSSSGATSGATIDEQLNLLSKLRADTNSVSAGSVEVHEETAVRLRALIERWKEDAKATEEALTDAQRRRVQLTAAPPYRATLTALRAQADAAARDAAAMANVEMVITQLSRVLSLVEHASALQRSMMA